MTINDLENVEVASRILVVDDDPMIAKTLSAYLLSLNFDVDTAEDGRIALGLLSEKVYDVVITDLRMPNMDGRTLLRRMSTEYPNIPRIVLTAVGDSNDIILALQTGAYDFITKPVMDYAILRHAVDRAIERKKLNDERHNYANQLNQINEIISMLNQGRQTGEIIKLLHVSLKQFIPFQLLCLFQMDEAGEFATLKYSETDTPGLIQNNVSLPMINTPFEKLLKEKDVQIYNDVEIYRKKEGIAEYIEKFLSESLQSMMIIPLIVNDGVRGFLIFASEEKNSFNKKHIIFMQSIVGQIAFSIQRAELMDELEQHTQQLERLVKIRTYELLKTQKTTIFALSKLAEVRDMETGAHLERIRKYCMMLAQILKYEGGIEVLTGAYMRDLYDSSILHDIGKVGIPDNILLKPGRLDRHEFEIIKAHTIIGYNALKTSSEDLGEDSFLKMAMEITLNHHERWDGSGYPYGLKGEEIPFSARIVMIADVYDALTMKRIYKDAFTHQQAFEIMLSEESAYDPQLFKVFKENHIDFDKIRQEYI